MEKGGQRVGGKGENSEDVYLRVRQRKNSSVVPHPQKPHPQPQTHELLKVQREGSQGNCLYVLDDSPGTPVLSVKGILLRWALHFPISGRREMTMWSPSQAEAEQGLYLPQTLFSLWCNIQQQRHCPRLAGTVKTSKDKTADMKPFEHRLVGNTCLEMLVYLHPLIKQ